MSDEPELAVIAVHTRPEPTGLAVQDCFVKGGKCDKRDLRRGARARVMPARKLKSQALRLLSSKTECNSGARSDAILPVVGAVGKLRPPILGLTGTPC
jgi:hypothetical protein